jgi:hypothetical protein
MGATVDIFGSSIVALGSFNPPIFTPDWFERNNLIGSADAQIARGDSSLVISQNLTHVATEWFDLQVLHGRLAIESKTVLSPQLKDLAVGMFSLLLQTPISALGLNFSGHYKFDTVDEYHRVGDVLAPKDIWNQLYPPEKNQSAGLNNLTISIQPCKRTEVPKTKDRKNITIQPSAKIKDGVYLSTNDHREIVVPENENVGSADIALRIIESNWQSSWDESLRIFDGIMRSALKS